MLVQSLQVRQDAGLLGLVGQLRSGGHGTSTGRHQERRHAGLRHLGLRGAHADGLRPLSDHGLDQNDDEWGTLCKERAGGAGGHRRRGQNFTTISPRYVRTPAGAPCSEGDPRASRLAAITSPRRMISSARSGGRCHPTAPISRATHSRSGGRSAVRPVSTSPRASGQQLGVPELVGRLGPHSPIRNSATAAGRARQGPAITLGRVRYGRRRAGGGRANLSRDTLIPRRVRLRARRSRCSGCCSSTARKASSRDRTGAARRGRSRSDAPLPGATPRRGRSARACVSRYVASAACAGCTRAAVSARRFRVPRVCHALPAGPRWTRRRSSSSRACSSATAAPPARPAETPRALRAATRAATSAGSQCSTSYRPAAGLAVTLRGPRRCGPGNRPVVARVHNRPGAAEGCARRCGTSPSISAAAAPSGSPRCAPPVRISCFLAECRAARATVFASTRPQPPRGPALRMRRHAPRSAPLALPGSPDRYGERARGHPIRLCAPSPALPESGHTSVRPSGGGRRRVGSRSTRPRPTRSCMSRTCEAAPSARSSALMRSGRSRRSYHRLSRQVISRTSWR